MSDSTSGSSYAQAYAFAAVARGAAWHCIGKGRPVRLGRQKTSGAKFSRRQPNQPATAEPMPLLFLDFIGKYTSKNT